MLSATLSGGVFSHAAARRHQAVDDGIGKGVTRLMKQIPDLVNGPSNTLVRIYVGAGIAEEYRWVPDGMFHQLALPDSDAITDDLVKNRVCAEATFHSLKLAAKGVDAAKARTIGLVLANGRVAMRRAWAISDADVIATQVMEVDIPAGVAAVPADVMAGVDARAAVPAGLAANGEAASEVTAGAGTDGAAFNAELVAVKTLYDAGADTWLMPSSLIAIGMPACNGATLVTTMAHHYVDPHKQICDAVFDQFVKDSDAHPPGISKDEYKDIACHKTAHIVQTPRLVGLARSVEVKTRLEAIGHGGATVRLPADFEAERAAKALQAVVRKGAAATGKANVAVSMAPVDTMVASVTAAMEANPNTKGTLDCKNLVSEFKETHGHGVAWLAGYLKAMYDDVGASKRARSAIQAKTLEGLIEDYEEAYAEGNNHYALVMKWRKARAREGYLDGYGLFGAAVPAPVGAPEVLEAPEGEAAAGDAAVPRGAA